MAFKVYFPSLQTAISLLRCNLVLTNKAATAIALRMTESGKSIAIIGAGPCGLRAAEVLASHGHQVTVCDRMASPGRKLLMAGRGGLNLTHSEPLDSFIGRYGAAADWLAPHIRSFTPDDLRAWCEGLGQETFVGSSGRVFPRSMKAAPLLRAWLRRLDTLGVRFFMRYEWRGWEGDELLFSDADGKPILAKPDATLLALGGASWPRLGSDGRWSDIVKSAGVKMSTLRPANCGFVVPWSQYFSTRFAGQPLKPLAITYAGVTRQGEAMITMQGLEGGVMYALSAALREAIEREGKAQLHLDLWPSVSSEALFKKLGIPRGAKSFSTYLRSVGLPPLAIALLREGTAPVQLADLTQKELAAQIKKLPITLTATAGITRAISTAGGIKADALDEHFMLRSKPGVFAAGEMLDWEAPTGGYLLQGCFSTATAAAQGVMRYLS